MASGTKTTNATDRIVALKVEATWACRWRSSGTWHNDVACRATLPSAMGYVLSPIDRRCLDLEGWKQRVSVGMDVSLSYNPRRIISNVE